MHTHASMHRHTHTQGFIFVLMTQFYSCVKPTHGIAGVFFLSLPPFSFSIEQAKSRGSAGLWRAEAANFLWALWSLAAYPWRLNQGGAQRTWGSKHQYRFCCGRRAKICSRVLLLLIPTQSNLFLKHWEMTVEVWAKQHLQIGEEQQLWVKK